MRSANLSTSLTISAFLLLAAGVGLAGCDGGDKTNPPDSSSGAEAGDEGGGEGPGDAADGGEEAGGEDAGGAEEAKTWEEMDRDARLTYMGTEVLPKMKAVFKDQGFETFKCANCHGEDYKDVDFAMPNDLTPLDPENPIQSGMDLDEDMTKFMVSTVLPQMAELLGEETDVTTGKGEFGCLSCHLSG